MGRAEALSPDAVTRSRATGPGLPLDTGENIKALAEYLGRADPGFTLRTPTRRKRPSAVPSEAGRNTADGPQTAQESENAL